MAAAGASTRTTFTGTSGTTAGITTSASGSTFVVCVAHPTAGVDITSVTDSKGNTYTVLGQEQNTGGGNSGTVYICENGVGGSSHTFTANSNASASCDLYALELTGVGAGCFDPGSFVQGNDAASPFTITSNAFNVANNVVVCFAVFNGNSPTCTVAESSGFTIEETQSDGSTFSISALCTKVVSATTALTPSFTCSGGATLPSNCGMFIFALRDSGTNFSLVPTYGTQGLSSSGGTSVSPNFPAAITSKTPVLMVVHQKPTTANGGTVTTPTGWTLIGSNEEKGGYGSTTGANVGNTNLFVYRKNTTDGTEAGDALAVTVGDNNVCRARMFVLPSNGGTFDYAIAHGEDTSSGNVSVACGTDPGFIANDLAFQIFGAADDAPTYSGQSITASGVTFGSTLEVAEWSTIVGNDLGGYEAYAIVSSGTSSGVPTFTATAGGTTTNARGPGSVLRVRETLSSVTTTDGDIDIVATVTGTGASTQGAAGSISAAATITGTGASTQGAAGSITSTATVTGTGASVQAAAGSISIAATVTGVGLGVTAADGSITIAATVTGTGQSTQAAAGDVDIAATVTGTGASTQSAAGDIDIVATVIGVSEAAVLVQAAGSITATADVVGTGASTQAADGAIDIEATLVGTGAAVAAAYFECASELTLIGVSDSETEQSTPPGGRVRKRKPHPDDALLMEIAASLVPFLDGQVTHTRH